MANGRFETLQGRSALVTGAAQGLGLAIARAFLEAGASVVLADVNPNIDAITKDADPTDGRAFGLHLDVREESAWESALRRTLERFGALDILVNNAALTISKPVWDISAGEWDDVLAVNLRGVFFGCRVAGRHMRERGFGRIIKTPSPTALRGEHVPNAVAYDNRVLDGRAETLGRGDEKVGIRLRVFDLDPASRRRSARDRPRASRD
ncbi:3-oxoacyl-[acyl-carrier protein] reductase [Rhizobiales bacterium GAS191]|nr:3-oxoacyl-[acyl-carrier protein] reductase [Rhizobiales bacterium GAS191]